jgi:hypothetical protein
MRQWENIMKRTRHRPTVLALMAGFVLLGGCATTQLPPQELTASRQAIRQAEQVDARELASAELRTAESKLQMAEAEVERGNYERAARLARQATVDAELAEVRARSARGQAVARELRDSIQTLREEIQRRAP